MNLIIDTSTENLKTILFSNENEQVFFNKQTNSKHLKTLLPEIEGIIEQANTSLKKIKTFCVVLGPGSFTGVRIGVSTVLAFIQVCKAKLVGINMLDLISFVIDNNIKKDCLILIKSTSTKFYTGFYTKDGNMQFNKLMTMQEIIDFLEKNKNIEVFSLNNSFELGNFKTKEIQLRNDDYINYSKFLIEQNKYITKKEMKPIYMAYSQAEEELMKKEKSNAKN